MMIENVKGHNNTRMGMWRPETAVRILLGRYSNDKLVYTEGNDDDSEVVLMKPKSF